jgi:hypothetical protein
VTKRNSRTAVLHLRKLKGESGTSLPLLSKARLKELIEEAVVDAYGEEEQAGGFFTMIEEHLALPFSVKVLGVDADVEKVDMMLDGQIVAICRRGKTRQKIPILDLPLPTPAPAGVEWIIAYRHWRRG